MSLTAVEPETEQLLMFETLPVVRIRNKVGGIKDFDSTLRGERLVLKQGDRVRVTIECVVDEVKLPEKHNGAGLAIGPLTRFHNLRALDGTAEVLSVTTREQVQEEWQRKVGRS